MDGSGSTGVSLTGTLFLMDNETLDIVTGGFDGNGVGFGGGGGSFAPMSFTSNTRTDGYGFVSITSDAAPAVPEASSLGLLTLGLLPVGLRLAKRRKA